MNDILKDVLEISRPLLEATFAIAAPVLAGLGTVIAAKVVTFLNVKEEAQRVQIEDALRVGLHDSALNAVRYALTKAGINPVGAIGLPKNAQDRAIAEAMNYVIDKNPETLTKLKVTGEQLRDIITSKLPLL